MGKWGSRMYQLLSKIILLGEQLLPLLPRFPRLCVGAHATNPNPRVLQTMLAAMVSKRSLQTVPHVPLYLTSSLPSRLDELPANLISEQQHAVIHARVHSIEEYI